MEFWIPETMPPTKRRHLRELAFLVLEAVKVEVLGGAVTAYVEGGPGGVVGILEHLGMPQEGDDGSGPCYSSKQIEYAKELAQAVPAYLQQLRSELEFYRAGYEDADGLAYDFGVRRGESLRKVVSAKLSEYHRRILDLEQEAAVTGRRWLAKEMRDLADKLDPDKGASDDA